jgi:hypothetical protein
LRFSPSVAIRCYALSCALLVRLRLRIRAPAPDAPARTHLFNAHSVLQWMSRLCPFFCAIAPTPCPNSCSCFHLMTFVMPTCNNRSTSALASTQPRPRPYPCILRAFYSKVAMTPLSLLLCNCAPSHDPAHTNLSFAHSTPQWLSRLYPCYGHHPLAGNASGQHCGVFFPMENGERTGQPTAMLAGNTSGYYCGVICSLAICKRSGQSTTMPPGNASGRVLFNSN